MTPSANAKNTVVVTDISPHNKALYEAGKSLLIDSVKTGRDFCKFMIGVATGAIPTYLGLLKFTLTGNAVLSRTILIGLIPPVLFLLATVLFVVGFFPQTSKFSLDLIEEIERERSKTISRRQRFAVSGFVVFCLGVGCGIAILLFVIGSANSPMQR